MLKWLWILGVAFLALFSCSAQYQTKQPLDVVDSTYVHVYGVEVPPEDWMNRGKSGKIITRMKNGVVVAKTYSDGKEEGETTYTFPHSDNLSCIETYSGGKLEKKINNYYCGSAREEIAYFEGGHKVTSWYEMGAVKSREAYEDGRLVSGEYFSPTHTLESEVRQGTGARLVRDEYGELTAKESISEGEMVSRTLFYPNGSPKEITPYKEGVVDGLRKTFLPAGEPSTIEKWDGGAQHGITVIFQNGEKYAEVPYFHGIKRGMERRFRNGKHVVEEISWYDDRRHGPSYTYIGDTVKTDYYYQGKEISKNQYEMLSDSSE